jgi:hypothetical protein
MDWYFSEDGDIKVSPSGDIAITESPWRDDAQQAYIRVKTEPADFVLYPTLGTELSQLFGMPQTEATGQYGAALIEEALNREGRFIGKPIRINAVPTGPQTIRFDIFIESGSRSQLILSVEQDLGVQ